MVERLGFPGAPGMARIAAPEWVSRGGHRAGSSADRGYGSAWQRARAGFLAKHPLCEVGLLEGRTLVADTIDHLYPHCGIKPLFWRREFWVACDGRWHARDKQRIERLGEVAIDELALRLGRQPLRLADPGLHAAWQQAMTS